MMINTVDLAKRYGDHVALDGVSLTVSEGSVYGLVGPNGAGKTTLLGLLSGLRRPTAGSVHIAVARRRMALLPDTPQFDPWLTGREVVALARTLVGSPVPAGRIDDVLRDAGLTEAAGRRVGGYSRGMLQRLGIAATVVGRPDLLLLDEPASALDPAGRREVLDLLGQLRGRATVLLSSHILADVQEVCDTVGVLRAGRLLYQGTLENLLVGRAVPAYRVVLASTLEPVTERLRAVEWTTGVEELGAGRLRVGVRSLEEAQVRLPRLLADCEARVISLAPEAPDLEDVFLELTS
jgi:ABC-2 type transport system ATP-binding protein